MGALFGCYACPDLIGPSEARRLIGEARSEPMVNWSALDIGFESVDPCTMQRAIYWLVDLTHKSDSLGA